MGQQGCGDGNATLIRNVCKSSLDESELDALHRRRLPLGTTNDALASILELHHRIQRGETDVSNHLSPSKRLMSSYSGAFATLLDEALVSNSEDIDLIELAHNTPSIAQRLMLQRPTFRIRILPNLSTYVCRLHSLKERKTPARS